MTTELGRVVYDREPHMMSSQDLARMMAGVLRKANQEETKKFYGDFVGAYLHKAAVSFPDAIVLVEVMAFAVAKFTEITTKDILTRLATLI